MATKDNGNRPALTDEIRTMLRGKMNVEVAALVATGDLDAQAAGEFLLERATNKAIRKDLIAVTA